MGVAMMAYKKTLFVTLVGCAERFEAHLKALYHAIRADCLLIEAARAHAINEQWAWRRIDKFTCTFRPAR